MNRLLFLLPLVFFIQGSLFAQANCSSTISYSVEKDPQGKIEVFVGELKAAAVDEVTAKSQIETEILRAKSQALGRCQEIYENLAGCYKSKLTSSASLLANSSFAARKSLEDVFMSDCKKQQGVCKEAKASEVKCTVAQPTPDPNAKGGDKKAKGK